MDDIKDIVYWIGMDVYVVGCILYGIAEFLVGNISIGTEEVVRGAWYIFCGCLCVLVNFWHNEVYL